MRTRGQKKFPFLSTQTCIFLCAAGWISVKSVAWWLRKDALPVQSSKAVKTHSDSLQRFFKHAAATKEACGFPETEHVGLAL